MGSQRLIAPCEQNLASLERPELLRSGAVGVRIYDSNTLQAQMDTDRDQSLSVFLEKSERGEWMVSFWKLNAKGGGQYSVEQDFFTHYQQDYTLLFSGCVKALIQMHPAEPDLIQQLRVSSYDAWIERNFLQTWNGDLNDGTIRVELLNGALPAGVGNQLSTASWK